MTSRAYLGDGVYVEIAHGMIRLTTENGRTVTNEIWLEPSVMRGLVEYLIALKVRVEKTEAP